MFERQVIICKQICSHPPLQKRDIVIVINYFNVIYNSKDSSWHCWIIIRRHSLKITKSSNTCNEIERERSNSNHCDTKYLCLNLFKRVSNTDLLMKRTTMMSDDWVLFGKFKMRDLEKRHWSFSIQIFQSRSDYNELNTSLSLWFIIFG